MFYSIVYYHRWNYSVHRIFDKLYIIVYKLNWLESYVHTWFLIFLDNLKIITVWSRKPFVHVFSSYIWNTMCKLWSSSSDNINTMLIINTMYKYKIKQWSHWTRQMNACILHIYIFFNKLIKLRLFAKYNICSNWNLLASRRVYWSLKSKFRNILWRRFRLPCMKRINCIIWCISCVLIF